LNRIIEKIESVNNRIYLIPFSKRVKKTLEQFCIKLRNLYPALNTSRNMAGTADLTKQRNRYKWGAGILLIIGILGLFYFEYTNLLSPEIKIKLLAESIVYLALLSIVLFYENHKSKLSAWIKAEWIMKYQKLSIFVIVIGLILIEISSFIANNGPYIAPIFMAAIAVGLFCASKGLTTN
jgi:hypothetical protein